MYSYVDTIKKILDERGKKYELSQSGNILVTSTKSSIGTVKTILMLGNYIVDCYSKLENRIPPSQKEYVTQLIKELPVNHGEFEVHETTGHLMFCGEFRVPHDSEEAERESLEFMCSYFIGIIPQYHFRIMSTANLLHGLSGPAYRKSGAAV